VEMKAEGRNIWGRDGRIISKVMPETRVKDVIKILKKEWDMDD
jgi:hypothetical protein